jgi:ACT domain-containing protein
MKTIKLKIVLEEEKDFTKFLKAITEIKEDKDIPFIFEVEEKEENK